ncbi:MAG: hypothetical protein MMC23_000367 [Stictis urceolatum]|nr:hypothetical protein [Stictis urceolata]
MSMPDGVWTGHVGLDIEWPGRKLEALQIHATDNNYQCLKPDASLSFLALLENSRVPLHLINGPALELYTENEETEQWIGECLFGSITGYDVGQEEDLVQSEGLPNGFQSDVGILLKVEDQSVTHDSAPRTTELLLYAAIHPKKHIEKSLYLLTPPRSSSPNCNLQNRSESAEPSQQLLRIYALPLSSDLRYNLSTVPAAPVTSAEDEHTFAFLPFPDFSSFETNPHKRQRLDTLFDDATQQNKRTKRKGGQSVSKLMADQAVPSPTIQELAPPVEMLVRKRPKPLSGTNGTLSRSLSMGFVGDLKDRGPSSRGGPLARTQRSNLHRVSSLSRLDSTSPTQSPGPETVALNETEQKNKTALSRIVMAGMRMYGLQHKRREMRDRTVSEVSNRTRDKGKKAEQQSDDDEYKLVYHQTYKSAAFVLRRQTRDAVIEPDVMRDTVDRLLAIFCVDPRVVAKGEEEEAIYVGSGTGLFDEPSGMAVTSPKLGSVAADVSAGRPLASTVSR